MSTIQLSISTWEKSFEDIYPSPHISVVTGNILITIITIIRLAHYHLLLASNSTFMTDSLYLGTIQICRNRRKIFSIPVAEFTSFSHQARALITNLLGFISTFSKYYFEIGTICLLFSSAHLFTALEFHGNHFAILLSKMVKPHDHNEIKLSIGKIFPKYIKKGYYFVMSRK